jgi:hypothetical protein
MSIIRVNKNANYFVASNEPFNDTRLSWEARGVMGYLLSKPDTWECRNSDLVFQSKAGRHVIERVLSELKQFGYLQRFRGRDEVGRIVWTTEIYEQSTIPHKSGDGTIPQFTVDGSAIDGKPGYKVSTEEAITEEVSTEEAVSTKAGKRAAATANPIVRLAIAGILKEAGINGAKREELLNCDHVTIDYAISHSRYAARNNISTGLLITKMLDGDPAPKMKGDGVTQDIPEELRGVVKR